MSDLKCPKCKEGVMRLPLALAPLQPNKPGSALTCSECGYQTTSLSELLPPSPPKG